MENLNTDKAKDLLITGSLSELSPYARFILTYLGYEFVKIKTGKRYSKGDMFWSNPVRALSMLLHNNVADGFKLVPFITHVKHN